VLGGTAAVLLVGTFKVEDGTPRPCVVGTGGRMDPGDGLLLLTVLLGVRGVPGTTGGAEGASVVAALGVAGALAFADGVGLGAGVVVRGLTFDDTAGCGPSGETGPGPGAAPAGHTAMTIAVAVTAAPAPAVVTARTSRRRAARRRTCWKVPGGGARTAIPGRSRVASSSSRSSSAGSTSVIKASSESGAQEFPCRV
jgi:hypothetical protein